MPPVTVPTGDKSGFLSLRLHDLICGEGFFAYQRKKPQE